TRPSNLDVYWTHNRVRPKASIVPIYMKFGSIKGSKTPQIKGGVTAKGHEGWIELQWAQLGVHRNPSPVANREEPSVSEIVVTKDLDVSSTELFRASLWGKGTDVEIHFVKTDDPNPYLTIKLKNVLLSNFSVIGHGGVGHSQPMESLSLNFTS